MAKLILQNQTEPTSPDAGCTTLYVDSSDGKTKVKDNNGCVNSISCLNPTCFGEYGLCEYITGVNCYEESTICTENQSSYAYSCPFCFCQDGFATIYIHGGRYSGNAGAGGITTNNNVILECYGICDKADYKEIVPVKKDTPYCVFARGWRSGSYNCPGYSCVLCFLPLISC